MEALRTILPEVQSLQSRFPINHTYHQEEVPQASPGQMLTHYAPTVPTFLFEGEAEKTREAMLNEVRRRQAQGERVGVLIANGDLATFRESGAQIYTLGNTLDQIAKHLFTGLRKLEEAGVHTILCRSFTAQGLGLAIRDRLRKAAGGKIVQVE
jgi:L-threonylcarbamoyladenylate synthase